MTRTEEGRTDDGWICKRVQKHLWSRLEAMLAAKVHVFSDSVFCTGPWTPDPLSASQIWEQKA